ncbi:MAG: type II toxin-antitoxin system HicB family antitoxin [archaeon]|nr:type II toxin-antitoxin system HicB family antitoxin [archaeon]
MDWKIVLEKGSDGYYTVTVPSLPGCISQGRTKKTAMKNIKEAIELHLESLAADGIPLRSGKESDVVAVRI